MTSVPQSGQACCGKCGQPVSKQTNFKGWSCDSPHHVGANDFPASVPIFACPNLALCDWMLCEACHNKGARSTFAPRRNSLVATAKGVGGAERSGYGTFKDMPLHECLFELGTYLERSRDWSRFYFLIALAATALWPIGWLLALGASYIGWRQKSKPMQMAGIFFLLANLIGLALSGPTLPLILWFGPSLFLDALSSNKISAQEILCVWLDGMLILMSIIFCMMHDDICYNVSQFKAECKAFLISRSGPSNTGDRNTLVIDDPVVLLNLANAAEKRKSVTINALDLAAVSASKTKVMSDRVGIWDIMELIEKMPGWPVGLDSDLDMEGDSVMETLYPGTRTGFFNGLQRCFDKAQAKGLCAVDVYMIEADVIEGSTLIDKGWLMMVYQKLNVIYHQVLEIACLIASRIHPKKYPFRFLYIFTATLCRALVPRLWVAFYIGEQFFPSDPALCCIACWNILGAFCTTFVWLTIFYVMTTEYNNNVIQAMMISALVDPRCRMRYVDEVLGRGPAKDIAKRKEMIAAIPLLNLRIPVNVTGFWRIREFGVVDRSNERMAMENLMDSLFFWFVINFALTLIDLFKGATYLSALAPLLLFDCVVYGSMGIVALMSAVSVNQLMEEHKRIFVESRYDTVRAEIKLMSGQTAREGKDDPQLELSRSQELLKQYGGMIAEVDVRETILLGLDVTPARVLFTLLTVGVATSTIIGKMYAMNQASISSPANFLGHASRAARAAVTVMETVVHRKLPGQPAW